jgi:hypothetical protein
MDNKSRGNSKLKNTITIQLDPKSLKELDRKCAELKITRKYFVRKCVLLRLFAMYGNQRWLDERRDDEYFSEYEEHGVMEVSDLVVLKGD